MKSKLLLNIFSKKKTKKESQKTQPINEKIIIDYREKNSLVASEIIHLGLDIEFRELKVADYIVKGTAIERKTISDFISSMINRRIFNQLEGLQQYESRLLIIEGIYEQELYSDSNEISGISSNAIRGLLLSILLKYKTPIIFAKDHEDTAKFILVLSRKKTKEIPLNVKKKSLNKKERMQFIIEGFPGIGPKTSKKLLKKFKTIKNLANAPEDELKEILGKKSGIFKKILDDEY